MIKQLSLILMVFAVSAKGEITSLGEFTLLSSIADAKALSVRLELSDDSGSIRTYNAVMNNEYQWQLTFFPDNDGDYYLSMINMIVKPAKFETYVEVSNQYATIIGRYPDRTSTPNALPLYMSNWNSAYTKLAIILNPGKSILSISLSANI